MRTIVVMAMSCILLTSQSVRAQFYFNNKDYYESDLVVELGGSFGLMNSLTDIGGKKGVGGSFIKDINWNHSKPCFGLYISGMYKDAIGLRFETAYGQVTGNDAVLQKVKNSTYGRYERNLSFKSTILDFQLGVEVHPLFFKSYDEDEAPYISPYITAGIGYFYFDPQAQLNGRWFSLQPLHTEGQGFAEYPDRKPYQLGQYNFAAGIGVKYELSPRFNARMEINHRFLNTDYLDDASQRDYVAPALFAEYLSPVMAPVATQLSDRRNELPVTERSYPNSQRGNPDDNDAFFTFQIKIGVVIGRQRR